MADGVAPTTPMPRWVMPGFAYLMLIAFLAITALVVWRSDDKYGQIVLQALINLVVGSMGYYFGSSSGSDKKDAITSAALTGSGVPPPSLSAALAESQAAHQ